MPVFLSRFLRRLLARPVWAPAGAVIVFVFVTSWPLMLLFEPGSEIVGGSHYWWWFLVTASTVGYGDLYPETTGGRLVALYVIVGGIATLTTLFTHIAGRIENAKGQRMRGTGTTTATGHVLLLGYTPGRTERIAEELLAEGQEVVLAAWDEVSTHPLPQHAVEFIRGDLADDETLSRAGAARAAAILVDARDDNEALAVTVVADHVAPSVHLVVALRDMNHAQRVRYVRNDVRCVQWHSPRLVTEELQDPGISDVYAELMTHGGENTYSALLPADLTFGRCQQALGERFGATALAVRIGDELLVSPKWTTPLAAGALLYYVCDRRLPEAQLREALRQYPV